MYCKTFTTFRDISGLVAAGGFALSAGWFLCRSTTKINKRVFFFGLAITLFATVLVAAWYRSNRLFLASIGVVFMIGPLLSAVFERMAEKIKIKSYLLGGTALFFFAVYLVINLSVFFEVQNALRPDGFIARTWDQWVREEYLPWMKEEQIGIYKNKLRRTGRDDLLKELRIKKKINSAKYSLYFRRE